MLFRLDASVLVLLLPSLLFALCFHEYAHAWMAHKLGDQTAASRGRLTLNPMAHLDPMGALMILFVGFGWAKPVPVDPRFFQNPRTGMMKVAFAGPASNLFLAFIGGILLRVFQNIIYQGDVIQTLAFYFTYINIMLAVFNMIPLPPLDGSQIFSGIMVRKNPDLVYKLQRMCPMLLIGLVIFGELTNMRILWWIMSPFLYFFMYVFAGVPLW